MVRFLKGLLMAAGVALFLALGLCFTPYPWRAYEWLGDGGEVLPEEPDVLVMLGGGGVPSESGLMRSYALAEAARAFPNALVAVAMPDTNDISSIRMRDELVLRGVKPERIVWEDQGRNTREQALKLRDMLYRDGERPLVLLVTSPAHMKRSLMTFRKAGFDRISGRVEFGVSLSSDLAYKRDDLGARPSLPVPDIGGMTVLRYGFWTNLGIEVRVLHECAALAYYRVMGWI